jgi:hypothetical protein
MGIAGVGPALVGKVVSLRHFGDAGLQGAFDGIAREIVSSVGHAQLGEGSRLAQPDSGQDVQLLPVQTDIVRKTGSFSLAGRAC